MANNSPEQNAADELGPSWVNRGRIPSLDGLRAIAVGLVLLAHGYKTKGFPNLGLPKSFGGEVGGIGVSIFFVLSGFLINTLILREIDRTGSFCLKGFYWRRILRIVPAYAVLLITVAAVQAAGIIHLRLADWLAAIFFTVNFLPHPPWEIGHAWSLSIEEHFYLLWPLLIPRLPPRWQMRILLGCITGCFVCRWIILLAYPSLTRYAELWTFTRFDGIASGCLLAMLIRDRTWNARLNGYVRAWPILLVLLLGSMAVSTSSAKWSVGIAYTLDSLCIAGLIWAAAALSPRWLSWRPLTAIGVGSYSIYLWQQPFINPHHESWGSTFPQNFLLLALIAAASYWLIEMPFLRIKERRNSPASLGQSPNEPHSQPVDTSQVRK